MFYRILSLIIIFGLSIFAFIQFIKLIKAIIEKYKNKKERSDK